MVAFPDHPHLIRCLDEIEGLQEHHLTRCAAWPAARLRREGTMAVLHQVVVHSYLGGCPDREIRILVIRQALYAGQDWSESGRCDLSLDRLEGEAKAMLPAEIGGGQVWNGGF